MCTVCLVIHIWYQERRGNAAVGSISQHRRKDLYLSAAKASTTPRRSWAGAHNWVYLWGPVCNDEKLFFFSFSFFLKLTLEFSGCTWVYFQSIVQGFHCAVHRKHSGIHGAETSRMLSESFSGITFCRTISEQTKMYCSYDCTTAEMCEVSQSFLSISSAVAI